MCGSEQMRCVAVCAPRAAGSAETPKGKTKTAEEGARPTACTHGATTSPLSAVFLGVLCLGD